MDLADLRADIIRRAGKRERFMVAIAGPPASGKSTTAHDLQKSLVAAGETAVVVPMDGFHFDDAVLNARGHRLERCFVPADPTVNQLDAVLVDLNVVRFVTADRQRLLFRQLAPFAVAGQKCNVQMRHAVDRCVFVSAVGKLVLPVDRLVHTR